MKSKLPLIIIAVVVLAAVAVVLFVFVLGGEKEVPIVRTEFSPGEYFVTNINGSNRLFKVTVVLVLNTDTLEEMLTEQSASIRDTIVTVLRSFNEDELKAVDLTPVKDKLITELNEMLEIDNITGILLTDVAIQ